MANPLARLAVRAVAAAASRQIATRVKGADLGPLGMVAMAVGAWGIGQLAKSAPAAAAEKPIHTPTPTVTPPPIAWSPAADAF